MQNVVKKDVKGETVVLDDHNFINCRLVNCRLVYSGGDWALTDTRIEDCQVTLSGAAQRTVNLLGSMGALKEGGAFSAMPPSAPPATVQ
jgi:hypothetical protein